MAIHSAFPDSQDKPAIVKRWETVGDAEPATATTQLIYELLVEIRTIKLILISVLVVIPVVAGGIILALSLITESQTTEDPFSPYGL